MKKQTNKKNDKFFFHRRMIVKPVIDMSELGLSL